MSNITTGKAPKRDKNGRSRYDDLIDAALDNAGEWVSMPFTRNAASKNPGAVVHSSLAGAVGRRCCEVSVRGDVVYLRMFEEPRR